MNTVIVPYMLWLTIYYISSEKLYGTKIREDVVKKISIPYNKQINH